ncbi:MAG: hypothetical protein U1A78_13270 [Polyangia bacterium]
MRRINKGPEPPALTAYKRRGRQRLDSDAPRQELREALCQEQRFLCAFCQSHITPDAQKMRIAHVIPQATREGANLGVEWNNLVGSCTGGEGKPAKEQHCDKKQEAQRIPERLDPVRLQEGTVRFDAQARILGCDPAVQHAIDDVLGLNIWSLRNLRDSCLKKLMYLLVNDCSEKKIREEISRLDDPSARELPVCVDYLLWRLHEKLNTLNKMDAGAD